MSVRDGSVERQWVRYTYIVIDIGVCTEIYIVIHDDIIHSDIIHSDIIHSDIIHSDIIHTVDSCFDVRMQSHIPELLCVC